jgi:glycosyltransferase involved in cell wall biosynthesis
MENKISIVIINDEGAEYLPKFFDSIKNQTVEIDINSIIFVDNASSDNSIPIAREFGIKNIFTFEKKVENRWSLYQKGADLSKSEYVIFAHSDIYFDQHFFENLYTEFSKNGKIDFANFGQYYADHSFFGNNQIGIDPEQNKLCYKQLFQTLKVHPLFECSEGCFMIKTRLTKDLTMGLIYKQSFFEYELIQKISSTKGTILNLESCKFTHYFIENQDKIKTYNEDEKIFLSKNNNLFIVSQKKQAEKLKTELNNLKNSFSYKLGRILTLPVRFIYDLFFSLRTQFKKYKNK